MMDRDEYPSQRKHGSGRYEADLNQPAVRSKLAERLRAVEDQRRMGLPHDDIESTSHLDRTIESGRSIMDTSEFAPMPSLVEDIGLRQDAQNSQRSCRAAPYDNSNNIDLSNGLGSKSMEQYRQLGKKPAVGSNLSMSSEPTRVPSPSVRPSTTLAEVEAKYLREELASLRDELMCERSTVAELRARFSRDRTEWQTQHSARRVELSNVDANATADELRGHMQVLQDETMRLRMDLRFALGLGARPNPTGATMTMQEVMLMTDALATRLEESQREVRLQAAVLAQAEAPLRAALSQLSIRSHLAREVANGSRELNAQDARLLANDSVLGAEQLAHVVDVFERRALDAPANKPPQEQMLQASPRRSSSRRVSSRKSRSKSPVRERVPVEGRSIFGWENLFGWW